jgi:hypothetical protein
MLRAAADRILADGGPLADAAVRLRGLDAGLATAADAERGDHAAAAAAQARAAAAARFAREHRDLRQARRQLGWLLRLEPLARERDAIRAALAAAGPVPSDIEARCAAVDVAEVAALRRARSAERTATERRAERAVLERQRDRAVPREGAAALRLAATIPQYRAQLLELAATRARLADLDGAIARAGARLRSLGDHRDEDDGDPARDRDLLGWQEQIDAARARSVAAEADLAAARARVAALCEQINRELACDAPTADESVDARWRCLWYLRRHLEEIWDVQSRAESNARAVADREQELSALQRRIWVPGRALQSAVGASAIAASLALLCLSMLAGKLPDPPRLGSAAALALLLVALYGCARIGSARERRRRAACDRVERVLERLRGERDRDWARAEELAAAIEASAHRLGMALPVTPEAVEAHEQELTAALRRGDGSTPLSALLRDLLVAEDAVEHAAAVAADATAAGAAVERQWKAWRTDAGLAGELDGANIAEWLAARRARAAARSARAAAEATVAELEPVTADWERAGRALMAEAGQTLAADVCGRALAAELGALATRVRAERQRRRRRAAIDAELVALEAEITAAKADAEHSRQARADLRAEIGAADDAALAAWRESLRRRRAVEARADRLDAVIETAFVTFAGPVDGHAELAHGTRAQWDAAIRRIDARAAEIAALGADALRGCEAEEQLGAAGRPDLAELRVAREAVLAEMSALAASWQRYMLAAALLDDARHEHERALEADAPHPAACPPDADSVAVWRATFAFRVECAVADALAVPGGAPIVLEHVLGRISGDQLARFLDALDAIARMRPIVCVIAAAHRPAVVAAAPPE